MALKDLILADCDRFLNALDFSDTLSIKLPEGVFTVNGSLQQNNVYNNSGNASPLQMFAWTLYVKYPISGYTLRSGEVIYIDDVAYKVVDISDEMGIATVHLTRGNGR